MRADQHLTILAHCLVSLDNGFAAVNWTSGRPPAGEFASYAKNDIDQVQGDDIVSVIEVQIEASLALLAPIGGSFAGSRVYAPGKWNLKELVGHLSDDERIFSYRCLCLARNDTRLLEGFDEKHYVRFAEFDRRPFSDLLREFRIVRQASVEFSRALSQEAWMRRGLVNGYSATVRSLAFHIAGHELHHRRIILQKYLWTNMCRAARSCRRPA